MKRIGFLTFGHYQNVPGSRVLTARDALLQTVELAVAADGIDAPMRGFIISPRNWPRRFRSWRPWQPAPSGLSWVRA
jgi:hypothetical protein